MGRASEASGDGRRLRRSSSLAGMGDGVLAVALPLLAAGTTGDPLAVAAVVAAHHLPWPLVAGAQAMVAGIDQRTVLGSGSTLRAAAALAVSLLALVAGPTVALLVVVALAAGLGAALADAAEEEVAAVGPSMVGASGLGPSGLGVELRRRGMVAMAVVGLPAGGLAYELAAALPFVVDVAVFAVAALSALMVQRPLPGRASAPSTTSRAGPGPIPRLASGTAPVTLAAAAASAGGGAVLGVLVLFAVDDLGLGAPAFGFLLAGLAAAATLGALVAPTVGTVLGLRLGAALALVVSGAGYAAAAALADPLAPLVAAVALGMGAGAGMTAGVLVRAQLHTGVGGTVEGPGLAAFHLRVWVAVPVGALVAGAVARVADVSGAVTAAGLLVGVSALTVASIPRWPASTLAPLGSSKK